MPNFNLGTGLFPKWVRKTITNGQSNLTASRIAAAHGRFNGIRQVEPVCILPQMCFLGPT